MAYTQQTFDLIDSAAILGETKLFKYTSSSDDLNTIVGSGYFAFDPEDSEDVGNAAEVGDFILVKASDGNQLLYIFSLNPTETYEINTNSGYTGYGMRSYLFNTTAGAGTEQSIFVYTPVIVTAVRVILKAAGNASNTVTVYQTNTSTAITESMSLNTKTTNDVVEAATINTTNYSLDQGDALIVKTVDGGSANLPACSVVVTAIVNTNNNS